MLGVLRFVLAAMVVAAHINQGTDATSHLGVFAVFGFYLISGYLITRILHETYDFEFLSFATNRALRLYPIYLIVALATLVVLLIQPESGFHPAWEIKARFKDLLGNLFIFPFEFYSREFRLVPAAWSIGVELINYFLLWLVVARSRRVCLMVLVAACVYHLIKLGMGDHWRWRYFPFYAALLPFSLGAMVYFEKSRISELSSGVARMIVGTTLVVWGGVLFAAGVSGGLKGAMFDLFFYVNLSLLTVMLAAIAHPSLDLRPSGFNKLLGDLSYPIFLVHWLVAYLVGVALLDGAQRGLPLLALSVPFMLAVSWGLLVLTDRLVNPVRDRVRSAAAARTADA